MHPARRELVTADGTTVSYLTLPGDGPAVVLLHGLAGSARELLPTARSLGDRAALLIDQRGHGHSTTRPADLSRAAFVADVVAVVETAGVGITGPVDLVGQSMGGHTAMLVAAARPDLVRRLVLLESGEGSGTPTENAALGAWFRSWPVPFANRDEAVAYLTGELGAGPLARSWADDLEQRVDGLFPRFDADVMETILGHVSVPRWAEWESVVAPTLVVHADGGMFTGEQRGRFVARGRDVTHAVLRNASHDAHLDAFEAWAELLGPFLR